MNTQFKSTLATHDLSVPNDIPFVKLLNTGKTNGKTIKEAFEENNKWGMDFTQECSYLYEHVLLNYNFAILHQLPLSLLDCPADSLVSCFLNAIKQGLSLGKSHPGYYLKCIENHGGSSLCSISYTSKGLSQLIGSLGVAKTLYTDVIYTNDEWAFMGADQKISHKIKTFDPEERGNIACAYSTAVFDDGSCLTVYVKADELKAARDTAKELSVNSGIPSLWDTVYIDEMCKTKPIYRLWKSLQTQVARLRDENLINTSQFEAIKSVIASVEYDSNMEQPAQARTLN